MGVRSVAPLVTPSAVEGSGCKCQTVSVRGQMSRLRYALRLRSGLNAALDMTDAAWGHLHSSSYWS